MEQKIQNTGAPLAGIRVIDLTSIVMGPYCTQILCDLGAEVIKVEGPGGDPTRHLGATNRPLQSGMFININRGKKSVVLDLKNKTDYQKCLDLIATADVLVHSMRPAAIARLGLDYDTVKKHNAEIVYANLYGFGRDGPYGDRPAYDDTIQAMCGMSILQSELVGEPQYVATVIGDKVVGMAGVYAIMAGVIHKLRTGAGQEIEIPMFETMASFMLAEHATGSVYEPPLSTPVYERVVLKDRKPFMTKSGHLSVIIHNDKQWRNFTLAIGRDDLARDTRFQTQFERSRNIKAFYEIVSAIFSEKDSEAWISLLEAAEIPVAKLNSMEDLYSDPHLEDVGFFKKVEDDRDGTLRLSKFPVSFSESPAIFNSMAPDLGQHTKEILNDLKTK